MTGVIDGGGGQQKIFLKILWNVNSFLVFLVNCVAIIKC